MVVEKYNLPKFVTSINILQILKLDNATDVVIYNRGVWGALKENETLPLLTVTALHNFSKTCYYKMMTSNIDRGPHVDPKESSYVKDAVLQAGCHWFDMAHLTAEFGKIPYKNVPSSVTMERDTIFVDEHHYVSWVYMRK